MRLLFQASTFRVAGAYLQFQRERHWHDLLLSIRGDGWGTGAIYLGYSRESFVRKEKDARGRVVRHFDAPEKEKWRAQMTGTMGRAHAVETRALALSAYMRPGEIVWFDNEDPSDVIFEQHELDYYSEFFNELAWTGTDRVAFRPGLYAHQAIAAQLLMLRQDLCLWEVDYGNNYDRTVLPRLRAPSPGDNQFGFDASAADLKIKAFTVDVPSPRQAWVAWPLWRQFEGNNQANIPQTAVGRLTPLTNWDFNSSLVRDPSDSVATPRLKMFSVGNESYIARVDDLVPQYNRTSGARELPRRGRLLIYSSPSFRTVVEVSPGAHWMLGPASPVIAFTQGTPELVVTSTLSEFGSTRRSTSGWTSMTPLWKESIYPEARFPLAFDGGQVGAEQHLFYATTTRQIYTARRKDSNQSTPWGDRKAVGGKLLIHPFATLAACARGNALHILSFDPQGRLVAVQWELGDKQWPANSFSIVSNDPLLTGSLALASPSASELVTVAIGVDMRLRLYLYQSTDDGGSWSASSALGNPTATVMANARLALSVVSPRSIDCVATGSDGNPWRYLLTKNQAGWVAPSSAPLLDQATPGAPAHLFNPNPHGDISSTKSPASTTPYVTFCGIGNGTAEALLSLSTGPVIRLLSA
jgi:hypothetical protein